MNIPRQDTASATQPSNERDRLTAMRDDAWNDLWAAVADGDLDATIAALRYRDARNRIERLNDTEGAQ